MAFETCYSTTRIPAERPGQVATVMHGTFQGQFIALSVRVRGSQYVWHPDKKDPWWAPYPPIGKIRLQPSRRVRKAAKMALRRWLA
jgi:hypothetical protein